MTLAKPMMRGLYARKIKIHLAGATACSIIGGYLFKVFYCDRRKKAYEDFYKTYDPDKQMQIMIDAGLLQGVKPGQAYVK